MAEHFLVDGVPPAVIGEGPPEIGPQEPDHAPQSAPRYEPRRREPQRREPPTDQLPVIRQLPADQTQPKKSLLARVFRLR